MRIGAVRAVSLDGDAEAVHGEHHRAGGVVHVQTQGHLAAGDVVGQRGVDRRVFQDAVCDHVLGALEGLLRRLEHELDGALQAGFVLLEHLRRGEQHGGVEVVAAGVRLGAGRAGEGLAALLGHGQRVHVCAQQNDLAAVPDGGAHAVAAGLAGDAQRPERLKNIGLRLGRVQADFGVGVKITAMGDGFRPERLCAFCIIHGAIHPSLMV